MSENIERLSGYLEVLKQKNYTIEDLDRDIALVVRDSKYFSEEGLPQGLIRDYLRNGMRVITSWYSFLQPNYLSQDQIVGLETFYN